MMYTIGEILTSGWNPVAIKNNGVDIVSEDILRFTFRRFCDRFYVYSTDDVSAAVADIALSWERFVNIHNADITKMSAAINTEYKPLDNYNMTESGSENTLTTRDISRNSTMTNDDTLTKTGTVTTETAATGKNVDTTTAEVKNTGTQTAADTAETINSIAAYNDTNVSIHDKQNTTTNGTRTDDLTQKTTNGGEVNTTASSNATITNNTNDTTHTATAEESTGRDSENGEITHTLTRSGNIGVTTSQQMLSSEIFLRVRNQVAYYAVELFISQFTIW